VNRLVCLNSDYELRNPMYILPSLVGQAEHESENLQEGSRDIGVRSGLVFHCHDSEDESGVLRSQSQGMTEYPPFAIKLRPPVFMRASIVEFIGSALVAPAPAELPSYRSSPGEC